MNEVYEYLKKCGTFYLATMDGDQPRVRPFGAVAIYEDKLYLQTGNVKEVYKQMIQNPKIELSGMSDGTWIRVSGTVVADERREARVNMLDSYPSLKSMYSADDGNTEVLYLKDATATIYSFSGEPKTITF